MNPKDECFTQIHTVLDNLSHKLHNYIIDHLFTTVLSIILYLAIKYCILATSKG